MTDRNNNRYRVNHDWLLTCAELEREELCGVAGGNYSTQEQQTLPDTPKIEGTHRERNALGAFAQLIEYGRRKAGLSIEALAEKAKVDLEELVEIERANASPSPRTLHQLASLLNLPAEPLAEVAGLVHSRDNKLEEAVYRFAARSEPNASLSEEEEEAYAAFVEALLSKVRKQKQ